MTSVVIPAHNEERVIGRCLTELLAGATPGELEVIVVCNGCSDDTVAIAKRFGKAVRVIETATADKAAALNLGDQAASRFPRVYLDADIVLPLPGLRELARCMSTTGALASTVNYRIELSKASPGVRRFYRARSRAPYPSHLVGRGMYALSEVGRQRFDTFPPLIADDLFVQSLFQPGECCTLQSCVVEVEPPRTVRELLRVQARVFAGNLQYRKRSPDNPQRGSAKQLLVAHISPKHWMDMAIYLSVVVLARARAWKSLRSGQIRWARANSESHDLIDQPTRARSGESLMGSVHPTRCLGLPVSLTSWSELERWSWTAITERKGGTVLTMAPYQAYLAKADERYRLCLESASAVLLDGNGVRLPLAVAGLRPGPRLTGRELVERFLSGKFLNGCSVAVIGGDNVAHEAIRARRPSWRLFGERYADQPDAAVVQAIGDELTRTDVDVVLVALGAPKQELWADALVRVSPRLYFCVGGAIDTATGVKPAPPPWVTTIAMEWAWRVALDPKLTAHLLRGASILPGLWRQALQHRARAMLSTKG